MKKRSGKRFKPYNIKDDISFDKPKLNGNRDRPVLGKDEFYYEPNEAILKKHTLNPFQKEEMLNQFEKGALSRNTESLKVCENDLTPRQKNDMFIEGCTYHSHRVDHNSMDVQNSLALFSSHPQRAVNPYAILSNDHHYVIENLGKIETFKTYFVPRRRLYSAKNPVDIGQFCKTMEADTLLSCYGTIYNAPRNTTCAIYRIDNIDHFFVGIIFESTTYMTEQPQRSDETPVVTTVKDSPPLKHLRGIPKQFFYFACDCPKPF